MEIPLDRLDSSAGYLLLEDGACFTGTRLLGPAGTTGEAVFNTSHSGYQEVLTDPSYAQQIVTFTAPHQGNVGINPEDLESAGVRAAGAVVRALSPRPSSWRSTAALPAWLDEAATPLLVGANTRAITLHLRTRGAMRAGLFAASTPRAEALEQIKASPSMAGADLASRVTCAAPYDFDPTDLSPEWHPLNDAGQGLKVAVLDLGVKRSILRELAVRGCQVTVLPAATPAEEILAGGYHGLLASNGPGDPAAVSYAAQTLRAVLQAKMPLFGICLGHQILALAAGAETFKLPFGHRGANHPVRREADGEVEITSQNHGFAVRPATLGNGWSVTHINLNDQTVEGIAHEDLPAFSVQYHPEASPGPRDALSYFDRFIEVMRHAPR